MPVTPRLFGVTDTVHEPLASVMVQTFFFVLAFGLQIPLLTFFAVLAEIAYVTPVTDVAVAVIVLEPFLETHRTTGLLGLAAFLKLIL